MKVGWNSIFTSVVTLIVTAVVNWFVTTHTINRKQAEIDKQKKLLIFIMKREQIAYCHCMANYLDLSISEKFVHMAGPEMQVSSDKDIEGLKKIFTRLMNLSGSLGSNTLRSQIYLDNDLYMEVHSFTSIVQQACSGIVSGMKELELVEELMFSMYEDRFPTKKEMEKYEYFRKEINKLNFEAYCDTLSRYTNELTNIKMEIRRNLIKSEY
ncbi:hypothetical protein ACFO26_04815 [Lactococcus nasutitermitis]|uniref:Phage protein n=1 Tax=Lactococcus nasutitermitis TaxID=1652957 RepID=A0ABV9JE47_9LACT|nr:hypothetical protein [Lactococcus nasutitermitis]